MIIPKFMHNNTFHTFVDSKTARGRLYLQASHPSEQREYRTKQTAQFNIIDIIYSARQSRSVGHVSVPHRRTVESI